MKRRCLLATLLALAGACSRLPALTPDILTAAEQKWNSHKPLSYRMVMQMSGDRVETGRFEVEVRSREVVTLRRNGLAIRPNPGQDYSMEGLFHMLEQEIGLAERPTTLGAPESEITGQSSRYAVYLTAKFDDMTGRLIHYRRIVGGTSNSIDVNILEYKPE